MGNCKICNKKLGIFEGYNDFDGEYCKACYGSQSKKKYETKDKEDKKLVDRINRKIQKEEELTRKEKLRVMGGWSNIFLLGWLIGWLNLQRVLVFKEKIE